MIRKIDYRHRKVLFALVMSASTAMIVSGTIIFMHTKLHADFIAHNFLKQWITAFVTAWPIVFIAILIIAPLVNKLLNLFVEDR